MMMITGASFSTKRLSLQLIPTVTARRRCCLPIRKCNVVLSRRSLSSSSSSSSSSSPLQYHTPRPLMTQQQPRLGQQRRAAQPPPQLLQEQQQQIQQLSRVLHHQQRKSHHQRCLSQQQYKPKSASSRRGKASLANDTMSQSSAGMITEKTPPPQNSYWEALEAWLRKTRTIPVPRWITPRHYTITISEVLGHSSFLLVAISYAVDDFLMLRCIAVVGSTAMLFFTYFHPHGRVLWLPFKWNVLFIAVNASRIAIALWNQYRAETIAAEFKSLRENNLPLMDPVAFYKLVCLGTVKSVQKGQVLVAQGEQNRYVRVLLEGELKVLRDGKLNYVLEEANFVSESGLHAGLLIPGSVESCCSIVADQDVRVLEWDRTQLIELLERDSNVRRAWQAAVSWDVVRKLKFQRTLLARGLIDDPEAWTKRRNEQTQHRYTAILQNILLRPKLIESRRKELDKYRFIHHIDDEMHLKALESCGWTPEEFEEGFRKNATDLTTLDDEYFRHDWKWYLRHLYTRIFG